MKRDVKIQTGDGTCPAYEFRPEGGGGPWPGVLFYMDGIGIRPAMFEIGERLAQAGYFALLPDLYWRAGAYEPMDAKTVFRDPESRKVLMSKFMSTATVANVMKDTKAFLAHLGAQADVRQPKIGTTGYCLGGRLSLCAAGHFPDRIAAAASFHGGNVANDAPDSPHLLAPQMKARVYVAAASNDPADQTARLDQALTDAKVDHLVETWPALHGWVPADTPVHDAAATERHWKALIDLFERTLKA